MVFRNLPGMKIILMSRKASESSFSIIAVKYKYDVKSSYNCRTSQHVILEKKKVKMSLWERNSNSLIHTTPPTDVTTATENVIIKISLVSKKKKRSGTIR